MPILLEAQLVEFILVYILLENVDVVMLQNDQFFTQFCAVTDTVTNSSQKSICQCMSVKIQPMEIIFVGSVCCWSVCF